MPCRRNLWAFDGLQGLRAGQRIDRNSWTIRIPIGGRKLLAITALIGITQFGRPALPGRSIDYLSFGRSLWRLMPRLADRGAILVAKTDPPLLSVTRHAPRQTHLQRGQRVLGASRFRDGPQCPVIYVLYLSGPGGGVVQVEVALGIQPPPPPPEGGGGGGGGAPPALAV